MIIISAKSFAANVTHEQPQPDVCFYHEPSCESLLHYTPGLTLESPLLCSSTRPAFPTGVAEDLSVYRDAISDMSRDKMYSCILLPRHVCSQAVFCTELFH